MKSLILQTHPSYELRHAANLDLLNNFTPQNLTAPCNNYLLAIPNHQKVISMDLEGYLPTIFEHEANHWQMGKMFNTAYDDLHLFYDCFSVNVFDRIYDFSKKKSTSYYIILKPTTGFQTWITQTLTANKTLPAGSALLTLESLESLAGVYYIPPTITNEALLFPYLEENAIQLLTNELKHFEKNKKYWPQSISNDTFHAFFKVEYHNTLVKLNSAA